MSWSEFIWFAVPALGCWIAAGVTVYAVRRTAHAEILMLAGIVIFAAFIAGLWIGQQRPPLRTIGETRLWYSFFLAAVGFVTYKRWRYRWLLSFAAGMAVVFTLVNLLKPQIHSANLMPALQSYWFVPHVTVYMLSYALFAAATVAACIQLRRIARGTPDPQLYRFTDNMVYAGFGLLMLGMLMGMVWAKEAWGHYWSWDPKETWAFLTAGAYLLYIHLRLRDRFPKTTLWMLPVAFILLMITWIGVNYLPAAQGSIHVY